MKSIKIIVIILLIMGSSGCSKPSKTKETIETLQSSFNTMKSLNQLLDITITSKNKGVQKKTINKLELLNTYQKGIIKNLRSKETKIIDQNPEEIIEFVYLEGVAQIRLDDTIYEQNTLVEYPLHYGALIEWLVDISESEDLVMSEENELLYDGSDPEVIASFVNRFKMALSGTTDYVVNLKVKMKVSSNHDLIEILEFRLSSNYNDNAVQVDGLGIFRERNQPLEIKLFR